MTSNPRFTQYVERIQEYLALFTIPDQQAETFLRASDSIANYDPKFLLFEILFNHQPDPDQPSTRKFDPHVSDKLLEGLTVENWYKELERLYINAEKLSQQGKPVEWQTVQWQTKEADELGLSDLAVEMKKLDEIHRRVCGREHHGTTLAEFEQIVTGHSYRLNDADAQEVQRILKKLIQRYELEYIPTNLAASGLLYEAWKKGKLVPLGNLETDSNKFQRLLDFLFVHIEAGQQTNPLEAMAVNLGLGEASQLRINESTLSDGQTWTSVQEPWFTCAERSLIYKTLIAETPQNSYIIHFPLIIDNYWFVGFCYIFTTLDDDASDAVPELFIRSKYAKFYYAIQSVSETLRFTLRADALNRVRELLDEGERDVDTIFAEVVKNCFVCFDVVTSHHDPNDDAETSANRDSLNTRPLYGKHGIEIYGPDWITVDHMQLLERELDGTTEALGFYPVPGLYADVALRVKQALGYQDQGKQEQSSVLSHQAAGLVAEVWCDPGLRQLRQQAQGCLWQLKTLIDIWGNFDLEPQSTLAEGPQDFPDHWRHLSSAELLTQLMDTGISHALRRATYRRASSQMADNEQVRQKALEIIRTPDSIQRFKTWVQLEVCVEPSGTEYPMWMNYRGFILCFHHAFWQAAFHGFRARCLAETPLRTPYVEVMIRPSSVTVYNWQESDEDSPSPRDREFYEDFLVERVNACFKLEGPRPSHDRTRNQFWEVIITPSLNGGGYGAT